MIRQRILSHSPPFPSLSRSPSAAPRRRAASGSDSTLRKEAAKADILIRSGAINPAYLDEPQFGQVLAEQFHSLSPENELKRSFVQPQNDAFDFAGLLVMVVVR